jgi:formate dehydrogenase subunit gamma
MIRDPRDLQRYTAHERANHWLVGICFILLALSGLAFFHPAFWPLAQLFGGGTWARILHPYIGLVLVLSFLGLFFRLMALNAMAPGDWQWVRRVREMVDGDDHNMPEQGKYNGGQKLLFWILAGCVALLAVSGLPLWRAWFDLPVGLVRVAAVIHAATAAVMIAFIIVHIYAAIWTRGTIRAMWYGTVTRAWAKQHHRAWYRQVTGDPR